MSGSRIYVYASPAGGLGFSQDEENGVVWVTTRDRNLGGWSTHRYGDGRKLNRAWVRGWAEENLDDPSAVTFDRRTPS